MSQQKGIDMKKLLLLLTAVFTLSMNASNPLRFSQIKIQMTSLPTVTNPVGISNVTVTIAGGSPNYTYTLTNPQPIPPIPPIGPTASQTVTFTGVPNLANYNLSVTDNSATNIQATLIIPSLPLSLETATFNYTHPCSAAPTGSINVVTTAPAFFFNNSVNNPACALQLSCTFAGLSPATYFTEAFIVGFAGQFGVSVPLVNLNTPVLITATPTVTTCSEDNGQITIDSITGSAAPYQVALTGPDNQNLVFPTNNTFSNLPAGAYTLTATSAANCIGMLNTSVGGSVGVSVIATPTATTCGEDNGQIAIDSITGSTAPYQVALTGPVNQNLVFPTNNTFSNLPAGAYTLTATSADNCIGMLNTSVGGSVGVSATVTNIEQPTCPGDTDGSITVSATPVGPQLRYTLDAQTKLSTTGSVTFDDLAPGPYMIMVINEATNCSDGTMAIVPQNNPIQFTPEVKRPTCVNVKNGMITLLPADVMGGTAPYTYSIGIDEGFKPVGDSFTDLKPNDYTVTVIDANGCESNSTIVTVEKAERIKILDVFTTPSTFPGFDNGSILIFAQSNAPLWYSIDDANSFQNSPLFEDLSPGQYKIVVNRLGDEKFKCASRTVQVRTS